MMKKMLVILSILILCASSVLGAVNLVDSTPLDGSTQYGNTIDFMVEGNQTLTTAYVWVDNGAWTQYAMSCVGVQCSLSQDVSGWEDYLNYSYYFTSEGTNRPLFPLTYTFFLDRPPSQVTGLTASGVSDSEIQLDWFANSESDIQVYNIYASMTSPVLATPVNLVGSTTGLTFTHDSLSTGDTWYYVVKAEDNNVEGVASTEVSFTVEDFTPPTQPVVTPPSGSTTPTTNPTIVLDYTAGTDLDVLVTITSGSVNVATFSGSNTYNWNPTLVAGVVYSYNIESCDLSDNCRTDSYTIMAEKDLEINATVISQNYIDYSSLTPLISSSTGDGNGYWLFAVDIESYGVDTESLRPLLLDFSGLTNILVNEDSQPIAFCESDLVGNDVSMTPTYNVYNMDNTQDLIQDGLNCPQQGISDIYESRIIFKIPIPFGTLPSVYTSGYAFYFEWE